MKDFFVSYNQADRAWAEWIAWVLEEADYSTVVQAWDFRPGSNFVLEMQRAATEAERTIAVLSPEYLAARFTQPEWAAAFARDPTGEQGLLLPVRVKKVDLQGLLPQINYIDLVGLDELQARTRLLEGVRRGRAKPDQRPAFPNAARSVPDRPRFPGTLPPVWNVPHHRNPNFTGRENILTDLHAALHSEKQGATVQAITGLGGKGKTQTAVEYAYRFSADYDCIWWVRAETASSMAADFAALAQRLDLPEKDEPDQGIVTGAVHSWLRSNRRWLLIFDNAEELEDVRAYIPQSPTGHVIITAREPHWGGIAVSSAIPLLEPEEAVEFLCRRTGKADQAGAAALAEELGRLPLALEQAAAYVVQTRRTLANYLDLFRQRRSELLGRGKPSTVYPKTVATTWDVSFQEVEKLSPAGADLLRLFAFLAPDDIPQAMLREGADLLPEPLAGAAQDELDYDDAVMALRRYSLVEGSTDALSVHRLVQAVVRDRMEDDATRTWSAMAVRLVNRAFPHESDDFQNWPACASLLPHALTASGYVEAQEVALEDCGRLLNQMGGYLRGRAQLPDARVCHERAIHIAEATYGPEHPYVATILSNLGIVLRDLGDLPAARLYMERALRISEAVLEPEHTQVATALSNLANVLKDLGELPAARAYLERALHIDESAYGSENANVASDLNNLGLVLRDLDDLPAAREHLERALRIAKVAYGSEHPNVAAASSNLGLVLEDLDDLPAARVHLERALHISEAVYGVEHPALANQLNNLASVLRNMGDFSAARAHLERAHTILSELLGDNHPSTIRVRENLEMLNS